MSKPRLFVDMDGTIAEWQAGKTIEDLYKKGYFFELKPYQNVLKAVKRICEYGAVEVFILSAVLQDSKYALNDKQKWLDQHLPEIDRYHRLYISTNMQKCEAVPGGIMRRDVLLDDYTYNLNAWSQYAPAIKVLNGVNGTKGTWKGRPSISIYDTPDDIAMYILNLVLLEKEGVA